MVRHVFRPAVLLSLTCFMLTWMLASPANALWKTGEHTGYRIWFPDSWTIERMEAPPGHMIIGLSPGEDVAVSLTAVPAGTELTAAQMRAAFDETLTRDILGNARVVNVNPRTINGLKGISVRYAGVFNGNAGPVKATAQAFYAARGENGFFLWWVVPDNLIAQRQGDAEAVLGSLTVGSQHVTQPSQVSGKSSSTASNILPATTNWHTQGLEGRDWDMRADITLHNNTVKVQAKTFFHGAWRPWNGSGRINGRTIVFDYFVEPDNAMGWKNGKAEWHISPDGKLITGTMSSNDGQWSTPLALVRQAAPQRRGPAPAEIHMLKALRDVAQAYEAASLQTNRVMTASPSQVSYDTWKAGLENALRRWNDLHGALKRLDAATQAVASAGEPSLLTAFLQGVLSFTATPCHAYTKEEISAVFDAAPAGRRLRTLAKHLGTDVRRARKVLDMTQEQIKAEAWNKAGDEFETLENQARVLKDASKVSLQVGGTMLTGGVASGTASLLAKGALLVQNADLVLEIGEDASRIALGHNHKVTSILATAKQVTGVPATIMGFKGLFSIASAPDAIEGFMFGAEQIIGAAQGQIAGIDIMPGGQVEVTSMTPVEAKSWLAERNIPEQGDMNPAQLALKSTAPTKAEKPKPGQPASSKQTGTDESESNPLWSFTSSENHENSRTYYNVRIRGGAVADADSHCAAWYFCKSQGLYVHIPQPNENSVMCLQHLTSSNDPICSVPIVPWKAPMKPEDRPSMQDARLKNITCNLKKLPPDATEPGICR